MNTHTEQLMEIKKDLFPTDEVRNFPKTRSPLETPVTLQSFAVRVIDLLEDISMRLDKMDLAAKDGVSKAVRGPNKRIKERDELNAHDVRRYFSDEDAESYVKEAIELWQKKSTGKRRNRIIGSTIIARHLRTKANIPAWNEGGGNSTGINLSGWILRPGRLERLGLERISARTYLIRS